MIPVDKVLCAGYIAMAAAFPVFAAILKFRRSSNSFISWLAEDSLGWGKLNPFSSNSGFRFSVPKSWFTLYYVTGVIVSGSLWTLVAFYPSLLRERLTSFDVLIRPYGFTFDVAPAERDDSSRLRQPYASADPTSLALMLMFVQTGRRLYECLAVNVFSDQRIRIPSYMVGHFHYVAAPLLLVLQSSVVRGASDVPSPPQPLLSSRNCLACAIFAYAWFEQHRILRLFARLRSGRDAKKHYIPTGSYWFELVVCPHFTMEIILYVTIHALVGLAHVGWACVVLFVIANQVSTAVNTLGWYRAKFEDFPPSRKAILPFLL